MEKGHAAAGSLPKRNKKRKENKKKKTQKKQK
jgi:hypothetical protein